LDERWGTLDPGGKIMRLRPYILILPATFALASCSSSSTSNTSGDPAGSSLNLRPQISECGGFAAQASPAIDPPQPDPTTYCEAERLLWVYDAAAGSLGLTNSRVTLNCCGDHSMTIADEGGTYVVTERDAPVDGDARCGCDCVFDFGISADPIPAGVIRVRLVRDVTDNDPPIATVWEGTLDLAEGQGSITIDTSSAEPWCSGMVE
jgi:hypothetical protein